MPASKSVTELTQVAARAIADKFGTEMIAIDLSDQMVLSEVFLIATGANIRQVDAIADVVGGAAVRVCPFPAASWPGRFRIYRRRYFWCRCRGFLWQRKGLFQVRIYGFRAVRLIVLPMLF